jgi:AraC-like DNA-binding protein
VYTLKPPQETLRPYIEHYWFVHALPRQKFELTVDVFVDGRPDLVFNFGAPWKRTPVGGRARLVRSHVLDAQRLEPIKIRQQGRVLLAGVRFHTGGLAAFLSASVHAWTGRVVPLAAVFGRHTQKLVPALRAAAGDADAQAALFDAFFAQQLAVTDDKRELWSLLSAIAEAGGLLRIDQLCEQRGIPIRRLDRLFRAYVGVSPKALARIFRFQTALAQLKRDPQCTLADVAARCGYYDQPHFVREFKRFAGAAPRQRVGYFPSEAPTDFSPNVVQYVQDRGAK